MAVFTVQTCAVEQVQVFDTLRVLYCEARGDPTSQRIAHEGYLRVVQGVEKAPDIEDVCADVVAFWSERRFAKTREVGCIDQIFFAQARHQQGPRFGGGSQAMNEDQGSTSPSGEVIVDRQASNIAGFFTHAPEEQADASGFCYCLHGTPVELQRQGSRTTGGRQGYKGWQGWKPGKGSF